MSGAEHSKLCLEIQRCRRLYYTEAAPIMSDCEFDLLVEKVIRMEIEDPELVSRTSPNAYLEHPMPYRKYLSLSNNQLESFKELVRELNASKAHQMKT